jgi:hypothetical protein
VVKFGRPLLIERVKIGVAACSEYMTGQALSVDGGLVMHG